MLLIHKKKKKTDHKSHLFVNQTTLFML